MPSNARWLVGLAAAAVVTAGASAALAVSFELAGTLGAVWGAVGWLAVAYPEGLRLHFRSLDGEDRWLAAVSLVVVAALLATVELLPLGGDAAALLFLDLFGGAVALSSLGALIAVRGGLPRRR
ncbi:MAG: hypothetical protein ABEJ22_00155 [Haloferacaceae archaeon]